MDNDVHLIRIQRVRVLGYTIMYRWKYRKFSGWSLSERSAKIAALKAMKGI